MAPSLFISYSHTDEGLRDQLDRHLSALKRQGLIHAWHDRRITAGQPISTIINANLDAADIILLLVSPDFIASDYCYEREMARAMEKHKAGTARVIPIILRPCDWHDLPFGGLLAAPRDGRAITLWLNTDEAFLEVVKALKVAVKEPIIAPDISSASKSHESQGSHVETPIVPLTPRLLMPEELFLLCGAPNGLVEASLIELAFANRIVLKMAEKAGWDNVFFSVIDPTPLRNPILDYVLRDLCRIADKSPQSRVGDVKLANSFNYGKLCGLVIDSLLQKQLIEKRSDVVLWFISRDRYFVLDNAQMEQLRTRLAADTEAGRFVSEHAHLLESIMMWQESRSLGCLFHEGVPRGPFPRDFNESRRTQMKEDFWKYTSDNPNGVREAVFKILSTRDNVESSQNSGNVGG